eukprot:scaffold6771_cov77-Cylindrotheca_fusiformis.AAC.1
MGIQSQRRMSSIRKCKRLGRFKSSKRRAAEKTPRFNPAFNPLLDCRVCKAEKNRKRRLHQAHHPFCRRNKKYEETLEAAGITGDAWALPIPRPEPPSQPKAPPHQAVGMVVHHQEQQIPVAMLPPPVQYYPLYYYSALPQMMQPAINYGFCCGKYSEYVQHAKQTGKRKPGRVPHNGSCHMRTTQHKKR